uniref:Uncharacterized protein n=1 Tax=Lygus hesperus TaxID=30085 RepID=A0A146MGN7_LYGHE
MLVASALATTRDNTSHNAVSASLSCTSLTPCVCVASHRVSTTWQRGWQYGISLSLHCRAAPHNRHHCCPLTPHAWCEQRLFAQRDSITGMPHHIAGHTCVLVAAYKGSITDNRAHT